MKVDNIAQIVAAGADTLVAGSAVFGAPDNDGGYRTVMKTLRKNADPHTPSLRESLPPEGVRSQLGAARR